MSIAPQAEMVSELPTGGMFRKRPVVVEAVQFILDSSAYALIDWANKIQFANGREFVCWNNSTLEIPTLEGVMSASPGDWIIRGVQDELYPCKQEIFAATYEPADNAQAALNARAGGDGWLPIESAPKDGSEFQAWFTHEDDSAGYWEPRTRVNDDGNIEFWGRVDYDQDGWIRYPELIYTHWRPLPTPPAVLASQAVGVKDV